jgi:hypothetical protein
VEGGSIDAAALFLMSDISAQLKVPADLDESESI